MNVVDHTIANPVLLLPVVIFVAVFGLIAALAPRQSQVSSRLARHRVGGNLTAASPSLTFRLPRLLRVNPFGRLTALFNGERSVLQARTLLNRAGNPMSAEAYVRMRLLFIFAVAPLVAVLAIVVLGRTMVGIGAAVVVLVTIPRLPAVFLQRKAKKRAKEMDILLSDVLDLLVVCVEGGQSLATGLMQVSNRMDNVASEEFTHLLADINSGLSRRDAFLALADRCQSEALGIACTMIVQADKVGMSIAGTLRTLSDMMRERRRQAAEARARQAPIKMMPVLVGFMLPAMLALLLGPVVIEMIQTFQ
jgi:tight adherence protein C